MLSRSIPLFILIICFITTISAQRAKNGNLTISSNAIVNEYTNLNADASVGDLNISLLNPTLNTNNRFPFNLSAGDLLMIIQMQGAQIESENIFVDTWGEIIEYHNTGLHELVEVKSVNGNLVELFCGLKNNYTANANTQVIRVPRYNNLQINNGGSLNCQIWNGTNGGVVTIETDGDLIINAGGRINANGLGFRGGLANENQSVFGGTRFADLNPGEGAEKGEGVAGNWTIYDLLGGRYCKGAPANAGGGGTSHNAGGGGGANASSAFYNGLGNPNISNSNWITAWNLEAPNFANNTSSGGGRGGYSFSGVTRDPLVLGPNSSNWAGDWRRVEGGRGGRPLTVNQNRIFMGGGGGAGDQNNNLGGNGGNGGGIVYIVNYGSISGSGEITANGGVGGNSGAGGFSSGVDGCGGGGGGGAIVVRSINPVTGVSLRAQGGNGGIQIMNLFDNTQAQGPGGGGSGGAIYHTGGNVDIFNNGGLNGTTNSATMSSFPPNGATSGGVGILSPAEPLFDLNLQVNNACIGANTTIETSLIGDTQGQTISVTFYDSQFNAIHNGNSYEIQNISGPVNLFVGTCSGNSLRSISITPDQLPSFSIGEDQTICSGDSVTLQSNNVFLNYEWFPVSGLSSINSQTTIATPSETTTYTLAAYNQNGCIGYDTVLIEVNASPQIEILAPTFACIGTQIQLEVSGADSYQWIGSNNLSANDISNPILNVLNDEQITILATNNNDCQSSIEIQILAFELAEVTLSDDQQICGNSTAVISASGAVSYLWTPTDGLTNPNSDLTNAAPLETTNYFVNYTDNNGCEGVAGPVTVVVGEDITASFTYNQIDNYNVVFQNTTPGNNYAVWNILGNTFDGNEIIYDFPFDGNFTVEMIVAGDCGTDTLSIQIDVIKQLSIEQIGNLNSLHIFPNPASSFVNLNFSLTKPTLILFQVFDLSGRNVLNFNKSFVQGEQQETLDLSKLTSGIYLLNIQEGQKNQVVRISVLNE